MPISYRLAKVCDLDDLIRLRLAMQDELGHAYPDPSALEQALCDYFTTAIGRGEFIAYLAESDGTVVACSGMVFHQHPPSGRNLSGREAYIMNMYTMPEFRGRGVATALLQKLVDFARSQKITRVRLHGLAKGRGIYEKAGFVAREGEMSLRLPDPNVV